MFWLLPLASCQWVERTNGPKATLDQLGVMEKRVDLTQVYSSSETSTQSYFDNKFVQSNQGWYPFTFGPGNAGLFVLESFYVYAGPWGGRLVITDCFCAGDKFIAYDNGDFLQDLFNCSQFTDDLECQIYEEDPSLCASSALFCSGTFDLEPGAHNITLQVTRSVFLGGTGYIKYEAYGRCGGVECELLENCVDKIVSYDSSTSSSSSSSSSD